MKTLICLVFLGILCNVTTAQTFIGSNPGLSSISSNPSLLAASKNKTEIQVFSASANFAGNKPYFNISHLNPKYFSNTIFQNTGMVSGNADINVLGPSVMKKTGNNTFAIFTRGRVSGTLRDFDGQLAHSLNEQYFSSQALPFKLSSNEHMRGNLNAWTEIGFSYSRTLINNGNHRLHAGSSVKLLAGVASADFYFGPFQGIGGYNSTLKKYAINEARGNISLNISGLKISGLSLNRVIQQGTPGLANVKIKGDGSNLPAFSNRGVGFDIGMTYEYRNDDESDDHHFRIGVAVVDLGGIRYRKDMRQSGSYNINVSASTPLPLGDLFGLDLVKARKLFEDHPENFQALPETRDPQFRTTLPTAFHVDLDQRIAKNVFVAATSHMALADAGWSYVSVIPRYETGKFAVALPVSYDWLSKSRAGLFMRYKFLTVGSSGLFTSIAQPTRQLDASLGASIGIR